MLLGTFGSFREPVLVAQVILFLLAGISFALTQPFQ
jgi:hypothetical protein